MSQCGKQDHCCYFEGEVCQYLIESPHPDFQFACSLRVKYGGWDETHKSPEYLSQVKPKLIAIGYPDTDCGDWPPPGVACGSCGINNG